MFAEKYVIGRTLGTGTYGVVYLVRNRVTGEEYAAKRTETHGYSRSDEGVDANFLQEYAITKYLGGKRGVLPVIDVFFEQQSDWLVIPVEDEDLTTSIDETTQWPVAVLRNYMIQLLITLQYIHSNGFIHCDVKPANILRDIRNNRLYLVDFGLAQRFASPETRQYKPDVATFYYKAPELLAYNHISYGPGVDIWAMGCTFAEMLHREAILQGQDEEEQLFFIALLVDNF